MYKLDKVFSFHISIEEKQAIEVLRNNGINISRFLRRALREQAKKLRYQNKQEQEIENNEEVQYVKT